MEVDLNQVKAFVKVVEAGSFTKAAALLKQPKSRVSRRVASLEQVLRIQLIYRTTRQLQLTDSGREFYEKSRSLITDLEAVADSLKEDSQEVSGLIRMTAPADMADALIPNLVSEFKQLYPKVRFQLLLSQELVDLVKESVDVALRVSNLKDSSMRMRKVADVSSILVASPALLEKHARLDRLEQLAQLPCLGFQIRRADVWSVRNGKEKKDIKINPDFICNNPSVIKELAVLGRGVALIPEFLCQEEIRKGNLVHLFKNWRSESAALNLLMPGQKELPLRIQKFVEFAARRLKAQF